jgi:predicted transcriptional regulator
MNKLTKAEEELMQLIWELGECTVGDVRTRIAADQGGQKPPHSTISTMLRILSDKGFLSHRSYGRTFVYTANLSKADYSRQSLRALLGDYFGGSARRMVSFLVAKNDLSLEELSELARELEEE